MEHSVCGCSNMVDIDRHSQDDDIPLLATVKCGNRIAIDLLLKQGENLLHLHFDKRWFTSKKPKRGK